MAILYNLERVTRPIMPLLRDSRPGGLEGGHLSQNARALGERRAPTTHRPGRIESNSAVFIAGQCRSAEGNGSAAEPKATGTFRARPSEAGVEIRVTRITCN
jgi:hypothetical protein